MKSLPSLTKEKTEEWRNIKEFPGYQVSSIGRVRSLDRHVWSPANKSMSFIRGKIRALDGCGKHYFQITLNKDGKVFKKLVHRLVAETFVINPLNLPEVNHDDLNKHNNCYTNLSWMSRLSNAQHAKANGSYSNFPKGEKRHNAILNEQSVRHIRQKVLRNVEYCRLYGVKPSTVSCLQSNKYGTRWSHV